MSVRILEGDALTVLRTLPSESVQCVVTSPPFFNLRDYGTATWDGGDPACDHLRPAMGGIKASTLNAKRDENGWLAEDGHTHPNRQQYAGSCGKCGARRIDHQIGLEKSPAAFIAALLAVFEEVRRVLRPDGLCFVNLGDSYAGSGKGPTGYNSVQKAEIRQGNLSRWKDGAGSPSNRDGLGTVAGIPAKNLLLIPERFAIAMQDAGWIVRSRIAWAKTSAMPESVRDRPTSAWEHIFMFSRSARYFYDQEAVRTPLTPKSLTHRGGGKAAGFAGHQDDLGKVASGNFGEWDKPRIANEAGASLRNFWLLGPEPSSLNHFASFVTEIPRRCIKAGTSERGQCPACGAPWARVVEREPADKAGRIAKGEQWGPHNGAGASAKGANFPVWNYSGARRVLGWQPSCRCDAGDPVPQTILDPFLGSGTTALVADQLGRNAIGVELNPAYAEMARRRIAEDAPMLTQGAVTVEAWEQMSLLEGAS